MYSLEVIAEPVFGKADRAWLEEIRQKRAHCLGPPHFTLVFPGPYFRSADFVQAVSANAAKVKRIAICLKSAITIPDPHIGCFHVFLVPDEGFGAIVKLHEALHSGALAVCLRSDFPYLPHVTVASTADFAEARRIAAKLNAGDFAIAGHIDELEIHRREDDVARCIAKVPLARHGLFG